MLFIFLASFLLGKVGKQVNQLVQTFKIFNEISNKMYIQANYKHKYIQLIATVYCKRSVINQDLQLKDPALQFLISLGGCLHAWHMTLLYSQLLLDLHDLYFAKLNCCVLPCSWTFLVFCSYICMQLCLKSYHLLFFILACVHVVLIYQMQRSQTAQLLQELMEEVTYVNGETNDTVWPGQ